MGVLLDKQGGYFSFSVLNPSRILKLIEHVPNHQDDLHCTVMFDKSNRVANIVDNSTINDDFIAENKGLVVLGQDVKYLAIKLMSNRLQFVNAYLREFGFKDSFEEFVPHITLIRDYKEGCICLDHLDIHLPKVIALGNLTNKFINL